jgi:glycosyltransferase involved in cell wall biosynthesis
VSGLVVDDPTDVSAVAGALAGLLDDPARRKQLGRAARCRVLEQFDLDALAARLGRLLEGAV